jgi:Holliday junction resolvasome RuvABC endonuclease subunit
MRRNHASALTLAVHPTSKGFGWALFEGPQTPVDWGISSAKGDRSAASIKRFQELLDQFQPTVLLLEKFEGDEVRRSERLRELFASMQGSAASRDMQTYIYSRDDIGRTIANDADATRYDVAVAVSERLPFLKTRLPAKRKVWESENDRRCLFDAVALGLTHYALTQSRN